jgi:PadR family transcriptional regulator PadR
VTEIDPQMLKGLLSLLLLSLIDEREDYGYSLVERLREGGLDAAAAGTVYPALARLERGGLVTTTLVPSDRGPARKYYALSTAGRSELASRLDSWRDLARVVASITKGLNP